MAKKAESEIDLRDYWEILLKRRFVFGIAFLVVFVIGAFIIFFVIALKYRATADVMVGTPPVRVVTSKGATLIRQTYEVTDALELMKSDVVAERVSTLLASDEYGLKISPHKARDMLRFSTPPIKRSKIIYISAISTEPKKAFLVAKASIRAYVEESDEYRDGVVKEMYDTLSRQLSEKHRDLEEVESELTKFVIEHDIIARGLEVGTGVEEEGAKSKRDVWRGSEINEKYLALKSKRINEETFLEEIKRHRQEDEVATLSIIAKKEKQLVDLNLRDELYEKERELARLLLTQSELHPDAIEAKGEVEEAKKKIGIELDRAIQSLERSTNTLKREEEKLRKLIKEGLSEKMVEYAALRGDVEVKRDIYDSVVMQLEELDVYEKLLKTPFLRVIKAPTLPNRPTNPRSKSILIVFVIAIFVGVGVVFLLEVMDISIKEVEDVEEVIGLTMLAAIPIWEKRLSEEAGEEPRGKNDIGLVTVRHPQSIMSEAFRTLRTNIKFVGVDKNIKSIVITSVGPREGKSFIASNLAVAMARAGEKVVLIDGDLRRPTIHKYFNIDNSKGLSNLLIGEDSTKEIKMHNTELENLKVIPSGPIPPNPNELLGTNKIEQILAKLKEKFDVVIIDATPVLTVSDSLILAAKTDGAVLVFSAHKTAKKAGIRAKLLLSNAGASVLGGILNGIKTGKGGYYYYSYEYYGDKKE